MAPLYDQGLKLFKGVIFSPLIQTITNAVLDDIRREREGELVDVDLLKNTVDIYLQLGSENLSADVINCKKILTDGVLSQTQEYYKSKSQ